MTELSQWMTDFKDHFESVEQTAQAFLAKHIPGLARIAAQVDADPLVQVALSTVLPPEAKNMVAQWIKDLEDRFPVPAAPEPAPGTPAEGVPVPEPEPVPPAG